MRVDQLQEYLKNFSAESEVRIKIGKEYHNIEEVIKGRFFATVELIAPQSISIEQAEGELFTGHFQGSLSQKREELIVKTIGQDRVDLLKKEVDKAKAERAAEEAKLLAEDEDDEILE